MAEANELDAVLEAEQAPEPAAELCCSVRLIQPFWSLLRRYPGFPVELLDATAQLDPDERLPMTVAL